MQHCGQRNCSGTSSISTSRSCTKVAECASATMGHVCEDVLLREFELVDEPVLDQVYLIDVHLPEQRVRACSDIAHFKNHVLIQFPLNTTGKRNCIGSLQVRREGIGRIKYARRNGEGRRRGECRWYIRIG